LKTALRETKEEIKLILKEDEDIIKLYSSRIPFFHFVVYAHQADHRIVCKHNHEFSEVGWFAVDTLPSPLEFFVMMQVSSLVSKIANKE